MRARGRRQSRARATPPLSPPHALLGDVTRARARTCIDGGASVLPVAAEGAEGSRRGRRQRRRERATAARPRPRARKRAPPRRRVPICSRLHASAVSCISIMLAAGWATAWPAAVARGRECDDNRSTLLPKKCTNQPSSLITRSFAPPLLFARDDAPRAPFLAAKSESKQASELRALRCAPAPRAAGARGSLRQTPRQEASHLISPGLLCATCCWAPRPPRYTGPET